MSCECEFCGKKTSFGRQYTRRGLAKKKGGIGLKTTGITKRRFLPNLQRKKVIVEGKVKKILVCTKCMKSGKLTFLVKKAPSSAS